MKPLGQAFSFLTVFGRNSLPSPQSARWFPIVGACIGTTLVGVWWGADQIFPPLLVAALVIGADAAVTGMLHFDGLADSADGLIAHLDRQRRLEVMRAPDIGAFALVVTMLVLITRVVAVASMPLDTSVACGLIALWALSRATMVEVMRRLPYARDVGLASVFARPASIAPASLAVAALVCLVVFDEPARQLVRLVAGLAGAVIAAVSLALFARRRLGGYTGDVLGAIGVTAETVGLIVLAARW